MKNYIMPPLVLTIICMVVSGLLAFAFNKTYVDTTGVMTDELKAGCEEIFGEGDFEILLEQSTDEKVPVTFDTEGIVSIITDKKDKCIIELKQDGYAKDGLHLLIGIDSDGTVKGISFLEIGETPGVGTKVQDDSFVEKFIGLGADADTDDIDNITGATFSSKGMKSAYKKAVTLYSEHKEEIFGG